MTETLTPPDYGLNNPVQISDRFLMEGTGVIASGGQGSVRKGYDKNLDQPVAIKEADVLEFDHLTDEAHITANSDDSIHIVKVYDRIEKDGKNLMVMEYLKPEDNLGERLRNGLPFNKVEIKTIMSQFPNALEALHDPKKGHPEVVIHRDLKPDNLFFKDGETLKIIDLGVSSPTKKHKTAIENNAPIASPGYASPETINRDEETTSSDLFAVGVIAFEMTTGINPFRGLARKEVGDNVTGEIPELHDNLVLTLINNLATPRFLQNIKGFLVECAKVKQIESPEEYADAILKAMSGSSENRFSSISEFSSELVKTI